MQMISESAQSSQTKLLGQRFHESEHGIAFLVNKGQKDSIQKYKTDFDRSIFK